MCSVLNVRGRDMAGFLRRHQRDHQRRRLTCAMNCCTASSHACVSSASMVCGPGLTVMTTCPPPPWNTRLWDVWEASRNPSPRGPKCPMACSNTSQGVSPVTTSYRIRLPSLWLERQNNKGQHCAQHGRELASHTRGTTHRSSQPEAAAIVSPPMSSGQCRLGLVPALHKH